MATVYILFITFLKKLFIYHSAIKKNEIVPFVTAWMDLEGPMLGEIS